MRPVNLLPGDHRPRSVSGARSGSAYVLCGALVALLVMAFAYVTVSNQVTERKDQTAKAERDRKAADAKAAQLGSFADFASVARTRSTSVEQLAANRFDWERLARELAHVLPRGVWITELDASTVPEEQNDSASGEAPITGPSAKIVGCAKRQPDVATLMVRLRQMHGVEDVKLKESSRTDEPGTTSGGSSSSAGGCGSVYAFELTVVFAELAPVEAPKDAEKVPARLGGGS